MCAFGKRNVWSCHVLLVHECDRKARLKKEEVLVILFALNNSVTLSKVLIGGVSFTPPPVPHLVLLITLP